MANGMWTVDYKSLNSEKRFELEIWTWKLFPWRWFTKPQ